MAHEKKVRKGNPLDNPQAGREIHEWDRALPPEEGHAPYLPLGNPEGITEDASTQVARAVDAARYPGRWTTKGRGRRRQRWWVPDRSDQYQLSAEDEVFQPGEVSEVWEAYRQDLVNRRPWLRLEEAYLQSIVIELEDGPRPISTFSGWLKPVLDRGLRRLRWLGVLQEQLKPNIWYRGKGRPKHYMVKVYSLEPNAVAISDSAADEDYWGES